MARSVPWGPRGKLATTFHFARHPYESARRWRRQFGPTFRTEVLSGSYVVTGDPNVVKDVFSADPSKLLPAGRSSLEPMMGPNSLFLLGPDAHATERRLLLPHFHGESVRAYENTIVDVTAKRIRNFGVGSTKLMLEEARAISAEVISRTVFGAQEEARVAAYLDRINRWVDAWKPSFILAPKMKVELLGLSPWGRFVKASEALDAMLYEEISERRRSGRRGADVLSLLLDSTYDDGGSLPDEVIRDHMRSLLFAGHETTMIAIAWVMHHLHQDEEALEQTREELLLHEDLTKNPWLDAVVSESLRVKPIILGVMRTLAESMVLGDYEIPAGATLNVSMVLLHSDPDLYPVPDAFRPSRFIERRPKPWEYAPFGGGRHRCLGAAFAQFEAKVVVATLLRHFRFEALGPREPGVVRRNLSMAPRGGIPLRIVERLL